MRKLKKINNEKIESVPGAAHESVRVEMIANPDSRYIYRKVTRRFDLAQIRYKRFRLYILFRERDRYELPNRRGKGDWTESAARFWAYYYLERSFDDAWRLNFFGEEV